VAAPARGRRAGGDGDEARTRRLESDDLAVQVLTVHRSKGLEFPVVCLPDLWDIIRPPKADRPVAFHDDTGQRVLDVGLLGREYKEHARIKLEEERAEELRLFYVALTRARHRAVVWWAGHDVAWAAPLTRLLFDRDPQGAIGPGPARTPGDEEMLEALRAVAARAPGRISVTSATLGPPAPLPSAPAPPPVLELRSFDRALDRSWRRTSYSALAAGAREARLAVGTEVEDDLLADEPAEDDLPEPAGGSALAAMPAGREVGTAIHRVLEVADFTAGDLRAELLGHLRAAMRRTGTDLGRLDDVAGDLAVALGTPLLGGPALTAIGPGDRLDELTFELPLAGGDDPSGHVTLGRLAGALHAHLPDGHPVRAYADLLATPGLGPAFRGYLTGSIDLVWRWTRGRRRPLRAGRLQDQPPGRLRARVAARRDAGQALLAAGAHLPRRPAPPPARPAARLRRRPPARGRAYLFLRGMTGSPGTAWPPGDRRARCSTRSRRRSTG
jgi:exodeoxyribonuclease V beta subunit